MLYNIFLVGCLLLPALAIPSPYRPEQQSDKPQKPSASAFSVVTGGPIVTGPSGAPYAMTNVTAGAHSTGQSKSCSKNGHKGPQSTAKTDAALPTADAQSASPNKPNVDEKYREKDDRCGAATVTVTLNPTVTVTAAGDGGSVKSSSAANEALPVSSEPALPELPDTSDTPATSATQASTGSTLPTGQPEPTEESSTPTTEATQSTEVSQPQQPESSSQSTQGTSPTTQESEQPQSSASPVESQPQTQTTQETQPTQPSQQPESSSSVDAAPSSEAPSSAPSSNPSPPASGLRTKRGIIASGDAVDEIAAAFGNAPKVSWLCNWYSAPPKTLPEGIDFVPQNYGKQSDIDGEWTKNAEKAVAEGRKYMLSFGEPGTPNDKLQMNPQEAVELWMQKMEPYAKQGIIIGAPGTLQNTQDFDWLSEFLDLCTECSIGFLAMHWYDKAELKNVDGFKETLNKAATLANGKPIWLDNFQAEGTREAQQEFLAEVVPWLDAQENIQAYAYVAKDSQEPGSSVGFLDGNNQLNSLGQFYVNL